MLDLHVADINLLQQGTFIVSSAGRDWFSPLADLIILEGHLVVIISKHHPKPWIPIEYKYIDRSKKI